MNSSRFGLKFGQKQVESSHLKQISQSSGLLPLNFKSNEEPASTQCARHNICLMSNNCTAAC